MAYTTKMNYACTLAQFNTLVGTTLPALNCTVILAPIRFTGIIIINNIIFSGTLTNGANTVSAIGSQAGLYVGQTVTGTGIPANTTIASLPTSTTATLSQNATASGPTVITTADGLGQIDFAYDGAQFLQIFGSNITPVHQTIYPGITEQQMSLNLVNYLTAALNSTLGAPLPSNVAQTPSNQNFA